MSEEVYARLMLALIGLALGTVPMVYGIIRKQILAGIAAAVVSVAVFAPVAEEMFFRGLLYRIFKGFFSPFRCGALISAVLSGALFALMHADAFVFLPLSLMGVLLCMSYEKSGSIISPILVHALFNALNLGIIWIAK